MSQIDKLVGLTKLSQSFRHDQRLRCGAVERLEVQGSSRNHFAILKAVDVTMCGTIKQPTNLVNQDRQANFFLVLFGQQLALSFLDGFVTGEVFACQCVALLLIPYAAECSDHSSFQFRANIRANVRRCLNRFQHVFQNTCGEVRLVETDSAGVIDGSVCLSSQYLSLKSKSCFDISQRVRTLCCSGVRQGLGVRSR